MNAKNGSADERRRLVPPPPGPPSALPRGAESGLLSGKTAVVTGAALGIGAGIAKALAYHGAALVLVDVDAVALASTAAEIERIARSNEPEPASDTGTGTDSSTSTRPRTTTAPYPRTVVVDVTAPGAAGLVHKAARAAGGADILVNNVGDYRPSGPFLTSTEADWDLIAAVNFKHMLAMTHALLPDMVRGAGGAILNVSSVEGLRGIPGNAVYGAMKAAVTSFTASLAAEVGQYGVRVNCLAPDLTDTPQTPLWSTTDERYADHVGRWIPVGRFGAPADHGDAAVFLVSDQSRFVTGVTLRVDGGTLAAPGWLRRAGGGFTNLPRPLG